MEYREWGLDEHLWFYVHAVMSYWQATWVEYHRDPGQGFCMQASVTC